MRGAAVVLAVVAGCSGGGGQAPDAAPSCAFVDGGRGLFGTMLGSIPNLGDAGYTGPCLACLTGVDSREDGNALCAAAYPAQPAGCEAVCDTAACERRCAGECRFTPDGGCTLAGDGCPREIAGAYVCDPTCGTNGGCRPCAHDSECAAQYGAGTRCNQHCGTCCLPGHCGCI